MCRNQTTGQHPGARWAAEGRMTLKEFTECGQRGSSEDVVTLMNQLHETVDLPTRKNVDYALGLIREREGVEMVHWYLNNGRVIQRNYAALYFIRREMFDVIREAVELGSIDPLQAWAR